MLLCIFFLFLVYYKCAAVRQADVPTLKRSDKNFPRDLATRNELRLLCEDTSGQRPLAHQRIKKLNLNQSILNRIVTVFCRRFCQIGVGILANVAPETTHACPSPVVGSSTSPATTRFPCISSPII